MPSQARALIVSSASARGADRATAARRCLHMCALASTRRATWAITLAQRAPTDQHAARWIAAAGADAARAWRTARRVAVLRKHGR